MTRTHEVHLHDPQTLYRHWEESQWNPWEIDLSVDREHWAAIAKVAFVTIYHLILESTLGLTTFEFSTRFMERDGLLPGFVAGYSKIHHDEHRHIGYGIWYLRQAVAQETAMGDVVRATLRELLPAVAESLTLPEGADASVLGASAEELSAFAPDGLTRRLKIIGVPIDTL